MQSLTQKLQNVENNFTTDDPVTFFKTAMHEFKHQTVSACWKNLRNEVVNDFKGFLDINGEENHLSNKTS